MYQLIDNESKSKILFKEDNAVKKNKNHLNLTNLVKNQGSAITM